LSDEKTRGGDQKKKWHWLIQGQAQHDAVRDGWRWSSVP